MNLEKKRRGAGAAQLLCLKKGNRTSDFQSNEPPPKFIQPPLPLTPCMHLGITYNPCAEGCREGGVIPKDIIENLNPKGLVILSLDYFLNKWLSLHFCRMNLGKKRRGARAALQLL